MRRMEEQLELKVSHHAREASELKVKCEELQKQLLAVHTAAGSLTTNACSSAAASSDAVLQLTQLEKEGRAIRALLSSGIALGEGFTNLDGTLALHTSRQIGSEWA